MQLKWWIFFGFISSLFVMTPGQLLGCSLTNPASLSSCIKTLLIGSRQTIKGKFDPLRLRDFVEGSLTGTNVVIRGISGFRVAGLSVSFPQPSQIAVRATISWPELVGNLKAKIRECRRFIFNICATVRGEPEIRVGATSGSLSTTLSVGITPQGQVFTTASNTNVALSLSSIRVKANVRGFWGFVNRIIGDPASRIVSRIANRWWSNNKALLERKAREALDQAVQRELSARLGRVLKIGSVSVPVGRPPVTTTTTTTTRRPRCALEATRSSSRRRLPSRLQRAMCFY